MVYIVQKKIIMKNLFLALLATFLVTSCTVKINIQFKEDFSGNLEYVFDMSEMYGLISDDTTKATSMLEDDSDMQASMDEMEAQDGISNVKLMEDLDKGIYSLSMDFVDIEALNEVLSGDGLTGALMDDSAGKSAQELRFERKKNKLFIQLPNLEALQNDMKETQDSEDGNMAMMQMFDMNYELNISFQRDIKKMKTKGVATETGKNLQFKMNLTELLELDNYDQDINVTF